MMADTRTNAGLDNVSTFRKLNVFEEPGRHVMALATAGNLSISQAVISTLQEGMKNPETGRKETLIEATSMFRGAEMVGRAIRHVHDLYAEGLKEQDISFSVSFLFGGQVNGGRMRLFMMYAAGNFIECTNDTPFLQIGEHKYGKPVLDRSVSYDMDLYDALKSGLISMDLDHALEHRRRHAAGCTDRTPRRRQCRIEFPHRAGRALFPRSARALVGCAARRPYGHSPPALWT